MLTRLSTRKVEIPGEEGEWAVIKPASLSDLEAAREVGLKSLTAKMTDFAQVRDLLPETDTEDVKGDPFAGTDIPTLLSRCVKSWSYDAEISLETVGDLDEATARFLAEQVYKRPEGEAGKAAS